MAAVRSAGDGRAKVSLHVDHDHESGEIRGLLCVGCNNALGRFRDSLDLLTRAPSQVFGDLLTLAEVDELSAPSVKQAGKLRRSPV
jgi:hypothetical protein